jgi:hypothetical protein
LAAVFLFLDAPGQGGKGVGSEMISGGGRMFLISKARFLFQILMGHKSVVSMVTNCKPSGG